MIFAKILLNTNRQIRLSEIYPDRNINLFFFLIKSVQCKNYIVLPFNRYKETHLRYVWWTVDLYSVWIYANRRETNQCFLAGIHFWRNMSYVFVLWWHSYTCRISFNKTNSRHVFILIRIFVENEISCIMRRSLST